MNQTRIMALGVLLLSLAIAAMAAREFKKMHRDEPIYPGIGVTRIKALSEYGATLKNSRGDTEVYLLEGPQPGATVLILGGTHPNEPAGLVTAICLIENCQVKQGRLIILPRANHSAFTTNDPQEANPQKFVIKTKSGERWFRFGSRATNLIDQWPDPEVYLHYPSGQKLSGNETRNLNRAYPGRPNGTLTERVAFAIIQLMREERVDLAIDLHEASLEYPVINAIVAHPLAFELAGEAVLNLQMAGLDYNLEPSPENFRGLSHREWGDALGIPAILMESANPVQGRYHDRLTPDMVVTGKDRFYAAAAKHGLLEVDYPETGLPLKLRVGRHMAAINAIFQAWNEHHPDRAILVEHVPSFDELQTEDIGAFLK